MARRKQQQPRANLGVVEERSVNRGQARHPAGLPDLDPEATTGFDLDEWEERFAIHAKPRKKRKLDATFLNSRQELKIQATLNAKQTWPLAKLTFRADGDFQNGPLIFSRGERSCYVDQNRSEIVLTVPGTGPDGQALGLTTCSPSEEVADAFVHCLRKGQLCLGPILGVYAGQAEGETKLNQGEYEIMINITEKAISSHSAKWEEDQRTSPQLTKFLRCIRWLVPHLEGWQHSDAFVPENLGSSMNTYDVAELYAAIKPTGKEPELRGTFPQLRPILRGYQRRAAAWMVHREKGEEWKALDNKGKAVLHPLWRELFPPEATTALQQETMGHLGRLFINPFTGLLSQTFFSSPPLPKGGIASDEMGLGKTVELLALIIAHPYAGPPPDFGNQWVGGERDDMDTEERKERIDCACGAYSDDVEDEGEYAGLWVQCGECLAWCHATCVGLHKVPPDDRPFTCGPCLRRRASKSLTHTQCKTTLIICPTSILRQWQEEIARHVVPGTLKVLVYNGQPQPSFGGSKERQKEVIITAEDLAQADIVLTTYDVLRKDVYHDSDLNVDSTSRVLRHRKKYQVIPTPLTRLRFWRVAIDEAQMVENSTAKAAEMALKLETEHRWCVTGTPVSSRGLEDLQGLMAFLQARPYATKTWWNRCIQRPCESGCQYAKQRLLALLNPSAGGLLWRSSKADVSSELALPRQHHHLSTLKFSAIERHFYSRQHQECVGTVTSTLGTEVLDKAAASAAAIMANESSARDQQSESWLDNRSLTDREERKLLHPLLKLRQACVHPQIGAGGIRALSQAQPPMTMSQVLEVLMAKAKIEAEDEQRLLLAALNGLAGLMLLEGDKREAIRVYREVLSTVDRNKPLIRADKLQQLHTLHNLSVLLQECAKQNDGKEIPHTLRDQGLAQEAAQLRNEYVAEAVARLAASQGELQELREQRIRGREGAQRGLMRFQSGLSSAQEAVYLIENWWRDAVMLLLRYSPDGGASVAAHIKDRLAEADTYRHVTQQNASSLANRFRDLHGLQLVLNQELKDAREARDSAVTDFDALSVLVASPPPEMVERAASCERCRGDLGVTGRVCDHCRLDEKLTGWEVRVFAVVASARRAGDRVSVEAAAQKEYAQKALMRRVGRGGLGEESGLDEEAEVDRRMERLGIARADVVRGPSQSETALRLLHSQLRNLVLSTKELETRRLLLVEAGKSHLEEMEMDRKEYLKISAVSVDQRQKLYLLDELEMCVMRTRLRSPEEVVKRGEELFKIWPAEIPVRLTELSADKAVASAQLARRLGTLRYLNGLMAQKEVGSGRGIKESPVCPVCQEPFGTEVRAMLPCGHQLCHRCQVMVVKRHSGSGPGTDHARLPCPTCRAVCLVRDVALVTGDDNERKEESSGEREVTAGAWPGEGKVTVQGSYGTKIEAIVRRIVAILHMNKEEKEEEDGHETKILVFSTWRGALEIVSHALTTASVVHSYPRNPKEFDVAIADFTSNRGGIESSRVLLMLTKQGGNGLNLQQAQHVIFVEPLMDPALEAQVIGRVDRMGQSRETHVHRFIIQDSVEENVQRMKAYKASHMDAGAAVAGKRGKSASDEGGLTLADVAALIR